MTLANASHVTHHQNKKFRRSKFVVRAAVGLVLAAGLAAPAMADTAPTPSIGDAVATGDAVEVHTNAMDPMQQQSVEDAQQKARNARQAAHKAVLARDKAKRTATLALNRARREGTSTAIRAWRNAEQAAKRATARAKTLKQAAKKATEQADRLQAAAMRGSDSGSRSAIAGSPSSTSTDRNRSAVMDLANQARALAGCDPLNYNTLLEKSAQGHAEDMSRNNYMSHTSLDGRTFDQRIRATGYDGGRIGENIGAGFGDPGAIMDAWMHSPAHKANILDCRFRNIGVGYDLNGGYWVQNFGA